MCVQREVNIPLSLAKNSTVADAINQNSSGFMFVSIYYFFWWSHCVEILPWRAGYLFPKKMLVGTSRLGCYGLCIFSPLWWIGCTSDFGQTNRWSTKGKSFVGTFLGGSFGVFFPQTGFCSPNSCCGSKVLDPPKNGLFKGLYPELGPPHMLCFIDIEALLLCQILDAIQRGWKHQGVTCFILFLYYFRCPFQIFMTLTFYMTWFERWRSGQSRIILLDLTVRHPLKRTESLHIDEVLPSITPENKT